MAAVRSGNFGRLWGQAMTDRDQNRFDIRNEQGVLLGTIPLKWKPSAGRYFRLPLREPLLVPWPRTPNERLHLPLETITLEVARWAEWDPRCLTGAWALRALPEHIEKLHLIPGFEPAPRRAMP